MSRKETSKVFAKYQLCDICEHMDDDSSSCSTCGGYSPSGRLSGNNFKLRKDLHKQLKEVFNAHSR
jgi:hypothetical protein